MLPIDHTSQQAVAKAAWGPQRKAGGKSQTEQANDWAQGTLGKTPKRLGAMVASGVGGAWRTGGWGTRVGLTVRLKYVLTMDTYRETSDYTLRWLSSSRAALLKLQDD